MEERLLGVLMLMENRHIEEERERLLAESATNRIALETTQRNVLEIFSGSEQNLLDDDKAIEIMAASKVHINSE